MQVDGVHEEEVGLESVKLLCNVLDELSADGEEILGRVQVESRPSQEALLVARLAEPTLAAETHRSGQDRGAMEVVVVGLCSFQAASYSSGTDAIVKSDRTCSLSPVVPLVVKSWITPSESAR